MLGFGDSGLTLIFAFKSPLLIQNPSFLMQKFIDLNADGYLLADPTGSIDLCFIIKST